MTYFDSLGVTNIPKKVKRFIGTKNISKNVFIIQAYDSIMCGYFFIGFIEFMLKVNIYQFIFSKRICNKWQNNFNIFSISSEKAKIKRICCVACCKHKKFKNPKISYIFEETLVLSIICSKCANKDEKIFKEEESIKILKILRLYNNIEQSQKNGIKNISQAFRLK